MGIDCTGTVSPVDRKTADWPQRAQRAHSGRAEPFVFDVFFAAMIQDRKTIRPWKDSACFLSFLFSC
jgi:hypothetical protein